MDEDPYLLIVKSIGTPSFDIILSWYLVAILLPAGWYGREIHGSESSVWSLESSGRSLPCKHKIYDHEYIITPEAMFNPLLLIVALLLHAT